MEITTFLQGHSLLAEFYAEEVASWAKESETDSYSRKLPYRNRAKLSRSCFPEEEAIPHPTLASGSMNFGQGKSLQSYCICSLQSCLIAALPLQSCPIAALSFKDELSYCSFGLQSFTIVTLGIDMLPDEPRHLSLCE